MRRPAANTNSLFFFKMCGWNGVLIDAGTTFTVTIMLMSSYALGQVYHQGGGIVIRVGTNLQAVQGWAFSAGLGEVHLHVHSTN